MCKGANAAGPRAKVQRWTQLFQVAGGRRGRGVRPRAHADDRAGHPYPEID